MGVAEWSLIVAVIALAVAGVALYVSWKTDQREARRDELAAERRDVVWEADLGRDGVFVLRNAGQDTAIDVHFVLNVSGDDWAIELEEDLGRVDPGEQFDWTFPEAEYVPPPPEPPGPFGFVPTPHLEFIAGSVHVTWKSPLGQHGERDVEWKSFR